MRVKDALDDLPDMMRRDREEVLVGGKAMRHGHTRRIAPPEPEPERVQVSQPNVKTPVKPKPKPVTDKPVAVAGDGRAVLRITEPVPTAELTASGHAARIGPNVLSFGVTWR